MGLYLLMQVFQVQNIGI